ncbi:molybdopterin-dependent oxidoreductase [Natronolimnobius sp. AArcel1]|uniref:molybdopterin-dependent oxidoreductase n=1 Tax=Natronolimnobius sp. AArcel1 TaxID=1679093 RepID=UPI0013ED9B39|nr:molybdopterin-dependent oxidoreductase [Natronolimnobius sp. AArcel1]NGM70692.1 molybdopterin-dependent oxidoreductase [Natronolimnobius sp. AArcel1]
MIARQRLLIAGLIASGVSAVATSFAIYATGQQFLVSSFNQLLLEYLPGQFVAAVIQQFGDQALGLSLVFSGGVLSIILGGAAVAGYLIGQRVAPAYQWLVGTVGAMAAVFVPAFLIVGEASPVLGSVVIGGVIAAGFLHIPETNTGFSTERRTVVTALGGVVAFNVAAHAIGLVRREQTQRAESQLQEQAERAGAEVLLSTADDAALEADGLKPLISEIGAFYTVDINPSPPTIATDSWSLSITGLVETETELTYDEIREEETVHEYKAIRCLSDDIDGEQLDTAVWTGVKLGDVLEHAGPEGEYALLTGADEYFYSIPLSDLEESTLAYGMNGRELPVEHGYPVRMLVPDRWGKLHVKWLTDIEIIDDEEGGYWEERGWSGMGSVNAVTKIDQINRPDGQIQVTGHAYAGARGVDSVEVSLDGGDTWEGATLSEELPDPDTTRQWMFEFDPNDYDGDEFDMYARTIDGEGTEQPAERSDPFPDGATGWAHRTLNAN